MESLSQKLDESEKFSYHRSIVKGVLNTECTNGSAGEMLQLCPELLSKSAGIEALQYQPFSFAGVIGSNKICEAGPSSGAGLTNGNSHLVNGHQTKDATNVKGQLAVPNGERNSPGTASRFSPSAASGRASMNIPVHHNQQVHQPSNSFAADDVETGSSPYISDSGDGFSELGQDGEVYQ